MGPPTGAAGRGVSKSPKQSTKPSPPRQDAQSDAKRDAPLKPDNSSNAEISKPLAPPPRPVQQQQQQQQQGSDTPDYFGTNPLAASLSLEPNPFDQSFGGAPPETPGGTKLPSVAALTSPSSLLPGNTPFPWGNSSLRTGPLSPAMLSGPTNDYFSDNHHIRGGFPTPNESSLRTGLTPGGSGSMFPAPSPNSQAIFAQIAGGPSATPGTIDFHRTALSAAAAKREQAQAQQQALAAVPTSQPQELSNGVQPMKPESKAPGPFDPHDNDAANGLFMLAQGRGSAQPPVAQQYPAVPPSQVHAHTAISVAPAVQPMNTSPQMNGGSVGGSSGRGGSVGSEGSDESQAARPNTRAKGKRNSGSAAAGSRRKADDTSAKPPASKKLKTNGGRATSMDFNDHSDDDGFDDDHKDDGQGGRTKMTDEEKRKNFLERNRVAALKCRQRKKQWLANLQTKVELFSSENDALTAQIGQLREEVVNLKTLLLAHKDCPVTQQQGLHGAYMQQTMEPFNPQMNPYGMAPPLQGQPVLAGQAVGRRFS